MATATYTTDLVFINDGANDSDMTAGVSDELDAPYNQAGTRAINEGDFFIQAAGCLAGAMSATKTGFVFSILWDAGSDKNADFTTDDVLMIWQVLLAGNAMETVANNGLNIVIATDTGNADIHNVGGNDSGRNPYGGWQNFAVDPTRTPETTLGSGAGTNWRFFGSAVSTLVSISKGAPNAIDAIRVGRGQLTVLEGFTVAEGTFDAMATANDAQAARWGLFSLQAGSYLFKGLMSLGTAATAVSFTDSNRNIVIDDTPTAYAAFNAIEIDHASSIVNWTNITISALGTFSAGTFEMLADATVTLTGCTFNSMNTFIFDANATVDGCTFNGSGLITQAGADLTDSSFATSTVGDGAAAILSDNLAAITGCTFTFNDGHAIELNASHAGGSYASTNNTFTGYGLDGTNDAAIYNNSGGAVTINVSGGSSPTVRNGAGASTTVLATVPVDIHTQDIAQVLVSGAQVYISKNPATGYLAGFGNTAENVNFKVHETLDADVPQTSTVIVYDVSTNTTLPYRYASHDSSHTLTFPASVSGTSTSTHGSPQTNLVSTSTHFETENFEEGDTIKNVTTGAYAVIDEITNATDVVTSRLSSGQWTSGDTFAVHKQAVTLASGIDTLDIPLFLGQTDLAGDIAQLGYKQSEAPTNITIRTRSNNEATKYLNDARTGTISATTGFSTDVTLTEDTVAT